jgi:hypothetical protein
MDSAVSLPSLHHLATKYVVITNWAMVAPAHLRNIGIHIEDGQAVFQDLILNVDSLSLSFITMTTINKQENQE